MKRVRRLPSRLCGRMVIPGQGLSLPDLLRLRGSEVRWPWRESAFYDLRSEGHGRDGRMRLRDLLKAYRKNRPPHDRFGAGPLAVMPHRTSRPCSRLSLMKATIPATDAMPGSSAAIEPDRAMAFIKEPTAAVCSTKLPSLKLRGISRRRECEAPAEPRPRSPHRETLGLTIANTHGANECQNSNVTTTCGVELESSEHSPVSSRRQLRCW